MLNTNGQICRTRLEFCPKLQKTKREQKTSYKRTFLILLKAKGKWAFKFANNRPFGCQAKDEFLQEIHDIKL